MVTYPSDWDERSIGDFVHVGRGASPRPIEAFLTSGVDGVNWIKIGDAPRYGKYITQTAEKITQSGAVRSVRVNAGDFILSNSMSFGRPYILNIDGCIHDGWLRLYDYQDSVDKEFLYYLLSSEDTKKQYATFAAGSGVQNLNKTVVKNLIARGYSQDVIGKAISALLTKVGMLSDNLTQDNMEVYSLLRYGCQGIKDEHGNRITVHYIDWTDTEKNDFYVAEEVTVLRYDNRTTKRPDLVLYINGIAVGMFELKRSSVSIGEGIRQMLTNQQKENIQGFFNTIQLLMAGNEAEGLKYGVVETPEKFYLQWREDCHALSLCSTNDYPVFFGCTVSGTEQLVYLYTFCIEPCRARIQLSDGAYESILCDAFGTDYNDAVCRQLDLLYMHIASD